MKASEASRPFRSPAAAAHHVAPAPAPQNPGRQDIYYYGNDDVYYYEEAGDQAALQPGAGSLPGPGGPTTTVSGPAQPMQATAPAPASEVAAAGHQSVPLGEEVIARVASAELKDMREAVAARQIASVTPAPSPTQPQSLEVQKVVGTMQDILKGMKSLKARIGRLETPEKKPWEILPTTTVAPTTLPPTVPTPGIIIVVSPTQAPPQ